MKTFAYWNEAKKVPSKREKLQWRGSKEVVVRRESRAKGEGDSERCNLPSGIKMVWFHLGNCPRNLGLNGKYSSIPDDRRFLQLIFALLISKIWDGCKTVKSQACTHCKSSFAAHLSFWNFLEFIIVNFEFDCSLKQSSWCILSRHLSSAQTKAALKPFYFAVHPDLFGQYPIQRVRKTFWPEILKL